MMLAPGIDDTRANEVHYYLQSYISERQLITAKLNNTTLSPFRYSTMLVHREKYVSVFDGGAVPVHLYLNSFSLR